MDEDELSIDELLSIQRSLSEINEALDACEVRMARDPHNIRSILKCAEHNRDRCDKCYIGHVCEICKMPMHKDSPKGSNVHWRCYRDFKEEIKA